MHSIVDYSNELTIHDLFIHHSLVKLYRHINNMQNAMISCASCGTAEIDDIKLIDCDDCDLVKYCSDNCKENHMSRHKNECKKRAAELREELLFKQPESSCFGDCPICCLPLSYDQKKCTLMLCCCKVLCNGCYRANEKREIEGRLQHKCAFCQTDVPDTDEETNERLMKLIGANDPVAMCCMGLLRCKEGDYKAAFEYWTRAAALGDANAHYQLSCLYRDGKGVEKDEMKELLHLEEAAIRGSPYARHLLGCFEEKSGKLERAAKHFIIAANLGYDLSMQAVKIYFKYYRLVGKEDFVASLRAHNAALDATKSPQEKRAAEIRDELLFKQPGSTHLGDCPICCFSLPLDPQKSRMNSCCGKVICNGCYHANRKREARGRLQPKCVFCRKALPVTDEEYNERLMKRVKANDPVAMCCMGTIRRDEGNYKAAFEYWASAAALGGAHAHYQLSDLYKYGEGVEKDEEKKLYHLEEAAIRGHHSARHDLGYLEKESGRFDRAVKHFIIGAKLGNDDSLEAVKLLYKAGFGSKDDFAAALRGHKAAIDATKSDQREEAHVFFAKRREKQGA